MTITVKFFASLRERVGKGEASLTSARSVSLYDIWQQTANIPMPDNTLCAVNMEYVDRNHVAQDGDEVAFFPPVTGG
ncbi:MAG: sulfur-carrier protein [Pseudomonadota bacterium]|nr:sulfur-carrier protein [Pseudomonadota bacterium]